MKFSSQEEYGLRCMVQLARAGVGGALTIPEMSRLEGLTQTHVAKVLMVLRRGGLIQSTRGQAGGYALIFKPSEIPVAHILDVLGGRLFDETFCSRHAGHQPICTHDAGCSIRSVWQVVQQSVDSALSKLTLADLVSEVYEPKQRGLVPLQISGQPL